MPTKFALKLVPFIRTDFFRFFLSFDLSQLTVNWHINIFACLFILRLLDANIRCEISSVLKSDQVKKGRAVLKKVTQVFYLPITFGSDSKFVIL
jgi:hypothetical protein